MSTTELTTRQEGRRQGTQSEPWVDDPYSRALRSGRGPLFLRRSDGWLLPLDVERWCAAPDAADTALLRRCRGPVLDIGCGPGRLVAALTAYGHCALGVDVSPAAVARTRGAGGAVLHRSVFERLPAEGGWATALLADGNIGIGGDPHALLLRIRELVAPGGRLLVEAAPYDVDERLTVRVEDARGRHGSDFPWARLGTRALLAAAADTGWTPAEHWEADGRPFVDLRHRRGAGAKPH
ncbi:class I SAM-dependent methyltransferase [Streptantibioticus ferralitis]|uniref:Class I SAM-dependent methyltransferase n=1 Tax=Streptantibioticus ferralitis TaxID=236510 RepID=A0ABT5Z2W8_9ACTN|nr:class I SAM-dependent methyltransferase [Streptantibioticus ferralitis]MDF2258186.1 class I SAM-dependent methyltransferase [Streptantibioticus ferralitis]